jgi:hypothetical protein
MRTKITWLILTAVGAVVIAGVVDSLRGPSSSPRAAHAGVSVVEPSTTAALPVQTATEDAVTTEPVVTDERIDSTVTATGPAKPKRLPSCETGQLRLGFVLSGGLAAGELRHVTGPPCHHGRELIRFTARDRSGTRVAVFGGNTRETQPADFSNGFMQLLEISQMSCDPEGSFVVVARVGPYVARRVLPGAELPCNHG